MRLRNRHLSELKGVSVLVVEDTWPVAKALKGVLEQLGMHVIGPTATTADARRLVASQAPIVALVDVNLKQEMAGDLIDELHERGIRVIIVSRLCGPAGFNGKGRGIRAEAVQWEGIGRGAACCCRSAPLKVSRSLTWDSIHFAGISNLQRTPSEAST